ncbi:MAG: YceI family protein [Flavobacteriales bacterium]|jgi:polyisoprenoid-binding protein YceI|nr:YceI family protein [Flavobacteriales bacterium]
MKNLLLLFATCIGLSIVGWAQEKSVQSGNILFHAVEKKEVKAQTNTFESKINLDKKTVLFVVPIESFVFKKGLMQEHFINENNMSASLFPAAKFTGKISSSTAIHKEGRHIVQVEGDMTIKGVTVPFSTHGLLTNKSGETVIKASFMIDGTMFGLDNAKIKGFSDKIEVALTAKY